MGVESDNGIVNGGNNGGQEGKNKKRKQRYLPHTKSVKKGSYGLHPGVQGFFLTCDGGRERQAANEALYLFESFSDELMSGKDSSLPSKSIISKPLNKITKFKDSDSSSSDDEPDAPQENENRKSKVEDISEKKQRTEANASSCLHSETARNEKSIDRLIEEELKEISDKSKRTFVALDTGCNGVVFIQMHKKDGYPSPTNIVQHMMNSAASTKKHMSRFILRVLPVEMSCYTSKEEISKAIEPIVSQNFPKEVETPKKFAVLFEARANTGVDRMEIIDVVAKSIPEPHKVDLNNPDKTIIVQVVKTVCLLGVVEKYKELSKFNIRQLTSSTNHGA